jgi:hypothetical protein
MPAIRPDAPSSLAVVMSLSFPDRCVVSAYREARIWRPGVLREKQILRPGDVVRLLALSSTGLR